MADPIPVLLLPGMDGTGDLFDPLIRTLPPRFRPVVVRYPGDRTGTWDDHLSVARSRLPREPFVVVGESFSGPIAWRLAATHPPELLGVLQVASFLRYPRPWLARVGTGLGRALFAAPAPDPGLRAALAGFDADPALVARARAAMRSVDPAVLAHRLRLIRDVDATPDAVAWPGPAVALFGSVDRLVPARSADALRTARPSTEIRWVLAPHFVAQRRPDAVVDALDALVRLARG